MKKYAKKLLSLLLAMIMLMNVLPVGALATRNGQSEGSGTPEGGLFIAPNGDEYTVLHTDYIAVYVSNDDGGFAILPADEAFDGSQERSYASFLIDGEEYRYGTYYEGVSGEVGIAPTVTEDGILEAHWQIGGFVISQIFAITQDMEHEHSYAVKVGFAAEYFGEGEATIGARILLDTQFTPDENIPVLLLDGGESGVLIETEAEISPAPISASISDEIIAEAGLSVEMNKGFILFEDSSWSTPDSVVFADLNRIDGYSYAPDWENNLFDGAGADSVALLYWDDVNVPAGSAAQFGTNYGFYHMNSGAVQVTELQPTNEIQSVGEAQPLTTDAQSARFFTNFDTAASEWFSVQSSVALEEVVDSFGTITMDGTVVDGVDLSIGLMFKPGTPDVIRNSVKQYDVWIGWDGGSESGSTWPVYTIVDVDELYTLSGDFFQHRADAEDLTITLTPIIEPAEGYTYIQLSSANSSHAATLSLAGDDLYLYRSSYMSDYFVKQGTNAELTVEMRELKYYPGESSLYAEWNWDYDGRVTLTPGTQRGPLTYGYTFDVPVDTKYGSVSIDIIAGTATGDIYPVNVKAYSENSLSNVELRGVEDLMWSAVRGTLVEGGLQWGTPEEMISIDTSVLNTYENYTINVYKAGTKEAATGVTNPVTDSFTMPSEAVDIVFEQGAIYRVFAEVANGAASVMIVPEKPASGDTVDVYVTNLQEGYYFSESTSVTSSDVSLASLPGYSWQFVMPEKDVTIEVALENEANLPEMYSVNVNPLVGDGMILYNVVFWTDHSNAARAPYQVDEAGRIGKIRAGTTVHYALFPTSWNVEDSKIPDMREWVVDDLTINGITVSGFDGINPGSTTVPSYFPYTYNPNVATATSGKFTMPEHDVLFEVTGYKKSMNHTMTFEAYDQNGNRLTLPESAVRSGTVSVAQQVGGERPSEWVSGLNVPALMDEYVCLEVAKYVGEWSLKSVEMEVGGTFLRTLVSVEEVRRYPTGMISRYYFQPQYARDTVVKATYHDPEEKTVTFTGFEPAQWNEYRPGEVRVYEGESVSLTSRTLTLRESISNEGPKDISGEVPVIIPVKFSGIVTLRWEPFFDNGIQYALPASGDGYTATLLRAGTGEATYEITLTDDASIAIVTSAIASDIRLNDRVLPNSPNSTKFTSIDLTAWDGNLKEIIEATPAPVFTSATLTANKSEGSFPKIETSNEKIVAAITYPTRNSWGHWVTEGEVMRLNLRELFDITEDFVFGGGASNEYTFTLEWTYGVNQSEKNSQSYTFGLSPDAYFPNEITYLGVVQADVTKPDGTGSLIREGSWYIVRGLNEAEMLADARKYSNNPPLLTFASEEGFTRSGDLSNVQYYGQGATIVMNGHAYFVKMPWSGEKFTITEENGSITVETINMRIGSKNIPVWLPTTRGANGLSITLEKDKQYTIPAEIPEYHKGNNATSEQAQQAWQEEVEDLLAETIVIKPSSNGVELSITLGEYDMQGLKVAIDDIYLLGHGFNIGGELLVQIPGTSNPVFRVAIVMLTTDNTAKLIPIDNVWAEGEGTVKLPDFIGGYGGSAAGVFNTYTQDFGFEGEVNLHVVELSGAFYLARSERFKIPVLDRFEVSLGADFLAAGLGIPPAPAQIIELQGVSMGVTKLADTMDYDPTKNTIPTVRLTLGGQFRLVEVISFEASMWSEMMSGGISVKGGLGIGPFNLDILKNLEIEFGVKDGPFEPYGDPGVFVKGKRSLLFFINANCHISLFSIVNGAGGFSISMQISPALWEKRGGFDSVEELFNFISLKMRASGYLFASVNVPFTEWSIADAEVRVNIAFEPGVDLEYAPFGLRQFEFVVTERAFGVKVGESRFDLVKMYPGLKKWLTDQIEDMKNKNSRALESSTLNAADATFSALNTFLADPAATGLALNESYTGEHRNLAFGNTVADSEIRHSTGEGSLTPLAFEQDARIHVISDNQTFTHYVTVPDDHGNGYVLEIETYGGADLSFADLSVIKPNGQALTIREISDSVTAEQAAFGYNAAVIDGVLTLALNDFMNTSGTTVNTDFETVSGDWQIASSKFIRTRLVEINALPGVKSVTINNNTQIEAEFENLATGVDYYYEVLLERKDSAEGVPIETYPLVEHVAAMDGVNRIELTNLRVNTGSYDMDEILASGDWYARVTLSTGSMAQYTLEGIEKSMLVTEYVDDKISASPYRVSNTEFQNIGWTSNFTAASGGNQSIDLSWDAATAPDGMEVRGYHISVYSNDTGLVASRTVTDTLGKQTVEFIEYDVYASDATSYEYNLPNIPTGSYQVGVMPLYSDVLGAGDGEQLSAVSRRGGEVKSTTVIDIVAAEPPSLSLRVLGTGNITREAGTTMIFAGSGASLAPETASGGTVKITEYDGTPIVLETNGTLKDLADYAGKQLMITAENAAKDATTELVTVFAATGAPILLPDNFDADEEMYIFTAYKDTGAYAITGQTDPGIEIGDTTADENGRFAISGELESGVDELDLTLSVADTAGAVTMREVRVVRGTDSQPASSSGGSSSKASATISMDAATYNRNDGKDIIVTLTSARYTLQAITNGGTPLVEGVDYTISGDTVTIKADYLATLALGTYKLTFDMNGGTDPVLTLTVEDGEIAVAWQNPFIDVAESSWYYDHVQYVFENGLFNGTSESTFSPEMPMTRGMLVTVLGRLSEVDTSQYQQNSFDDVAAGQFYAPYTQWAKENEIVLGIGNNLFAPEEEITRQDVMVILHRYAAFMELQLPKTSEQKLFEDDSEISSYAREALYAMQQAEIIVGKLGNLADPKGVASRAEVAAMLHYFMENVQN